MSNTFLVNLRTTPKSVTAPVDIYLQGVEDFLIPLVFPDYEIIVVGKQKKTFLGVTIESDPIGVPKLGHAGVLLIEGKTGKAEYFEYGRYDRANPPGLTKRGDIPACKIVGDQLTESSLKKTLRTISIHHGKSGDISGVVYRGNFFANAIDWLHKKEAENVDNQREPYAISDHNCMTFVTDLVEHLGFSVPWEPFFVIPSVHMEKLQDDQIDLEYNFELDKVRLVE